MYDKRDYINENLCKMYQSIQKKLLSVAQYRLGEIYVYNIVIPTGIY